jgi:N-acetylglutamate synthase-like GNAT family acetyltransferase
MLIQDIRDQPRHLPTLAAWHHHEWWSLNPGCSIEQRIQDMQAYLSSDLIPSTFIATQTELIGSAALVAHDMDVNPELTPWLASVFVASAYRNQGIGSQLVKYVMQKARQGGIETLYLFTSASREAFYRKLGWEVFAKQDYYGNAVSLMRVELN